MGDALTFSHASESAPVAPMAGGLPISAAVADAAADWLTLLMSGEATEADCLRWRQWRDAHPDHERAWRHIEAVTRRFKAMEPRAAYAALSACAKPRSPGRRKALNLLLWGGAIGVAGSLASHTRTWQQMAADYRTATGEQRSVVLDDGTRVMLNTASAIDVRFDERRRLLRLVAGEAMISTGHPVIDGVPDPRPFLVATDEGRVRPLGTRFIVRQEEGRTGIVVLESAVEITPQAAQGRHLVLHAGERTRFTRLAIDAPLPETEQDSAWTRGQIVADGERLADFLADLARYRRGIVRCAGGVANLRVSGVFPLGDTDRILATLPKVLPVRVRRHTRYWVAVEAIG